MVLDLDVADTVQLLELRHGRIAGETKLHLVVGEIPQRIDAVHAHQPAIADDRHAIATALDFAQDVAGEEDRPAVGYPLAQQREERLLNERVEAGRRFVEQQQLGLVLQRRDQPDLLLVALRVLAEAPARVQVEALDQLGLVGAIHAATQVAEVFERLPAGQSVVQRELARQVADTSVDGRRVG